MSSSSPTPSLPPILSIPRLAQEIARRGGATDTRTLRRFLVTAGAVERSGRRYYTSQALMWERAPLLARAVFVAEGRGAAPSEL